MAQLLIEMAILNGADPSETSKEREMHRDLDHTAAVDACALETRRIEKEQPSLEKLAALGVLDWHVGTEAPSVFERRFDRALVYYVLEGEATVSTPLGEVSIQPGDMVTFPVGLESTWSVRRALGTHYSYL
ncbi:MAG: DUF861 domain-containing protein [Candidatus Wallbacteria bacterium]|nr:DUF861 domain-containing protein [Candidatus Wallbacteria bacterium]